MGWAEYREQWGVMMTQAAGFAESDNHYDARSRAQAVVDGIQGWLAEGVGTERERGQARALLKTAERLRTKYALLYEAWLREVEARRSAFVQREQEAYASPLRVPQPAQE